MKNSVVKYEKEDWETLTKSFAIWKNQHLLINQINEKIDVSQNSFNNQMMDSFSLSSLSSDSTENDLSHENESESIIEANLALNELDPTSKQILFKKLSMKAIEDKVLKDYTKDNETLSAALDILACYLKGQKTLYLESKEWSEGFLNRLMLPAIFLSSISALLNELLECKTEYKIILSGISCIITFLLSVIQYLKLDARAEGHRAAAHQFDKLQSHIEFCSGALLLFEKIPGRMNVETEHEKEKISDNMSQDLGNTLSSAAAIVKEIKVNNKHSIPKQIRVRYPTIYNINIFTFIKKIRDKNLKLITQLKNIKNEIRFINKIQLSKQQQNNEMSKKYKFQIMKLFEQKKKLINELLLLKSSFSVVEQIFIQEIENAEVYKNSYWFCFFFKSKKLVSSKEFKEPSSCLKRACQTVACKVELIDPLRLNTFISNLLDPYNDSLHECKENENISHLETLWFKSSEDEWLKKNNVKE